MNLNQKIKLYQALRDAAEVLDEICDQPVFTLLVLSDIGCEMDNDDYNQMIDFIDGQEQ